MFFLDRERYITSWLDDWLMIFEWGAVSSYPMLNLDFDLDLLTSALISSNFKSRRWLFFFDMISFINYF
jgi:hypothetical protein